ncbi:MAG: HDIG domain-containing protein [Desulfotalea sp.]
MKININNKKRLDLFEGKEQGRVLTAIHSSLKILEMDAWLVGGTVRDFFLERQTKDLDIVVSGSAHALGKQVRKTCREGALIILGDDSHEETCRFVHAGVQVDIASFRGARKSLLEDLALRDFTINALALPLAFLNDESVDLVDPLCGYDDLQNGIIRHCENAFSADGLRILRGYRFCAELGFKILSSTVQAMVGNLSFLETVSEERIFAELDYIVCATHGSSVIKQMAENGVLAKVLPELNKTVGVEQSGAHHLNVFEHSLMAHTSMKQLLLDSESYGLVKITDKFMVQQLLWAALLHDIGKPANRKKGLGDKITFHRHDEDGAKMIAALGRRLKWSNRLRENVAMLTSMHMHPFHLCTVQAKQKVSKKAALKLYRRAGELLVPLFYLSLSDSLASQGVDKPEDMEDQLVLLYKFVMNVYEKDIKPNLAQKLLTGAVIRDEFNVTEGPKIGALLKEIEEMQVAGELKTVEDAKLWLKECLAPLS